MEKLKRVIHTELNPVTGVHEPVANEWQAPEDDRCQTQPPDLTFRILAEAMREFKYNWPM